MRKVPCVIYKSFDGKETHVKHGTEYRARRNANLVNMPFHWHEQRTFWDSLREKVGHAN